ncbi:MAG: hypothetical protein Q7V57_17975 [Actinomycetota bacterium]|nr:hypothetical protein [Actinomycetota bacterium]
MRKVGLAFALVAGTVFVPVAATVQTVAADGPGVGTPWVVSLGDSYISGEGGRWAGNSNSSSGSVDAGGSAAYFDNATHTAETINRCHRSTAAEIHIGGGVNSANLACSGAKTSTFTSSDGYFKPGIDFYNSGGNQGQALALQNFAATHNVKMIQLSIGGNNFGFADIIQRCVTNFLTSPSWWKNYCNDDSAVTNNFTTTNVTNQTNAIKGAINNVKTAMANAGYTTGQYKIVVQTYPSPVPTSTGFRYSESGYTRQSTGGCGFWNADANWANNTALVKINNSVKSAVTGTNTAGNIVVLDLAAAFNGRRLCENTVNLMENSGKANWTVAGASDATEWIAQIRTLSTVFGPYYVQESLHPNWWGEKAIRNCVRQAYNGGAVRGGVCNRGTGLNANGEPNMTLV